MERKTFTVKLEPEEDLEYILHREEKLEIKSESDIMNLEESFKEEVRDHQEPECGSWPVTCPPIKEELPTRTRYPGRDGCPPTQVPDVLFCVVVIMGRVITSEQILYCQSR
uniref:Uncharacterized protein n=1 Tax=Timema douglasi TaxID=61478 RepID=A0A7R8VT60_TIMDO|nr:unnamed protein product [Timema douglasi]